VNRLKDKNVDPALFFPLVGALRIGFFFLWEGGRPCGPFLDSSFLLVPGWGRELLLISGSLESRGRVAPPVSLQAPRVILFSWSSSSSCVLVKVSNPFSVRM